MVRRRLQWIAGPSVRRPDAAAEPIRCAPVHRACTGCLEPTGGTPMNGIIYLIGLIVVIMAILSLLGLR
jgi:hypothetical protein